MDEIRQAFEEFIISNQSGRNLKKHALGSYESPVVEIMWEGFARGFEAANTKSTGTTPHGFEAILEEKELEIEELRRMNNEKQMAIEELSEKIFKSGNK